MNLDVTFSNPSFPLNTERRPALHSQKWNRQDEVNLLNALSIQVRHQHGNAKKISDWSWRKVSKLMARTENACKSHYNKHLRQKFSYSDLKSWPMQARAYLDQQNQIAVDFGRSPPSDQENRQTDCVGKKRKEGPHNTITHQDHEECLFFEINHEPLSLFPEVSDWLVETNVLIEEKSEDFQWSLPIPSPSLGILIEEEIELPSIFVSKMQEKKVLEMFPSSQLSLDSNEDLPPLFPELE